MKQSYQEISEIVAKDLKRLRKLGIETLSRVDIQRCFFIRKNKHPEKYERLMFDTNGHEPYSKDLSSILTDFRICGILETRYDIIR